MRLSVEVTVLAVLVALGCDDGPRPTQDGGEQPAHDGGPQADAGSGQDADAGAPDGGSPSCPTSVPALGYEEIAPGQWVYPVAVVQPPESDDLYVVDQIGSIRIVRDGAVLPAPFLDLGPDGLDRTDSGGAPNSERGLLGLAFHPDYPENGRFFVYYTAREGSTMKNILAEYRRDEADPDRASPAELAPRLIDVDDPYPNHNGGQIAFGRDGFLYVAMGDGGSGGDPGNEALDTDSMLGKIHRLDVDNEPTFAAADNPFASGGGLPQVWVYGLRNPWRFSFDRMTGDLWIGDVGQGDWEEIDFQPGSSPGGENFGWSAYEGTHVFRAERLGDAANHTPPLLEYAQRETGSAPLRGGRAVIGGYVYRGDAIPALRGWYLFGDSYSPDHAAFYRCDAEATSFQRVAGLNPHGTSASYLTSFGQDNDGELYMTGFSYVARIVAR